MDQDIVFVISLPVALAFVALVLLLILMLPALARELAMLRRPPDIRPPAPPDGPDPGGDTALPVHAGH